LVVVLTAGCVNGFDAPEMMSARQGSGFSSKSARDRSMIGSVERHLNLFTETVSLT
jgi:hypothetical protein